MRNFFPDYSKKKNKWTSLHAPFPQAEEALSFQVQSIPQAIHLLSLKAKEGSDSFQETVHSLHQTLGNQQMTQIFRSLSKIQKSPQESASQAFQHATADGAHEIPYRQEMENSFGVSFQNVKAFFGGKAQAGMDALGAEAAAFSNKVAFRTASPSKETVAHELTHVLQQGGHQSSINLPQKMDVSHPSDPAELEADQVGKMFK
jgi:hypothetical protein